MAMKWKVAFPLHPEYRTLPMVWYIPPLSPIQSAIENGLVGENGIIPSVDAAVDLSLRYRSQPLTARCGRVEPIKLALERMIGDAPFQTRPGGTRRNAGANAGSTPASLPKCGRDALVIALTPTTRRPLCDPTSHKEMVENSHTNSPAASPFGNGSGGESEESLFGKRKGTPIVFHGLRKDAEENREKGVR